MNEFRLDPESMSFTLITDSKGKCKACSSEGEGIASIPFERGFTKVYEIKDDVQPSKYELKGGMFKSSEAHGYEEIIVDSKEHVNKIRKYTADELGQLLSILVERAENASKYDFGDNLIITRTTGEHGYFDLLVLPIPKTERKTCFECEALQKMEDREVYKTEHFTVYVPFAPKYPFELVISPRLHKSFSSCDDVLLFDLAVIIKKTLEAQSGDLTIAIVQDSIGHFKVRIIGGNRDPFNLVGISVSKISPSLLAKGVRDMKIYGKG